LSPPLRTLQVLVGLGLVGGLAGAGGWAHGAPAAGPSPAVKPEIRLPPLQRRPLVVVDRLKGMGLLAPSGQNVTKVVVLELNRRYGEGACVIEDELWSLKELRRMAGRGLVLPESAQRTQDERVALLEWAVKESPYRVKVGFKRQGGEYVASVECRAKDSPVVIHRVEGRGKGYEAPLENIQKPIKTFCAVLDGAAAQRAKATGP
jgi:hypothetical protein